MLAQDLPVGVALGEIERQLAAAGVEEPRREARLLLAAATGWSLATVMAHPERPLAVTAVRCADFLAQRLARKPLSRILGVREFYGLPFRLGPATLDPRPDTEILVDVVLATLRQAGLEAAPVHLLDIGTGTGAILLALLHKLPGAEGLGIDIAPGAVAVARENAERLGLSGRAAFREGDLFVGIDRGFDVIVSNPPYIATADLAALEPEVVVHDPMLALDGGEDGYDLYRRLAQDAPAHLRPGGWLVVEVGVGQAATVAALFASAGLGPVTITPDLAGIDRVVCARANPGENHSTEPA